MTWFTCYHDNLHEFVVFFTVYTSLNVCVWSVCVCVFIQCAKSSLQEIVNTAIQNAAAVTVSY